MLHDVTATAIAAIAASAWMKFGAPVSAAIGVWIIAQTSGTAIEWASLGGFGLVFVALSSVVVKLSVLSSSSLKDQLEAERIERTKDQEMMNDQAARINQLLSAMIAGGLQIPPKEERSP